MPKGQHLIAGNWVGSDSTFNNEPVSGPIDRFAEGTRLHIDSACDAAEAACWSYSQTSGLQRATFLRKIAAEIDHRGDEITAQGVRETGLPAARLTGERVRTTGQLEMFAQLVESGDHLDFRHDHEMPDRIPPRPDIQLIQRPLGPVAVFGASNFPLAFSTAGGDTAAALAAGCPVIVKGHPAHPGVSEIVAEAIHAAIRACDIHPGVFSLVQGSGPEIGAHLVRHPLVEAVGFTGSLAGGRALFDLCVNRPRPIPFYGEMGAINPVFLLPTAMSKRSAEMAQDWAQALTLGAGQFCTNPGVIVMLAGADAELFKASAARALAAAESQTMLTERIASTFNAGRAKLAKASGMATLLDNPVDHRHALPSLFTTTAGVWLANRNLQEEVFGPAGIIVTAEDTEEMLRLARSLDGQLTCTIHLEAGDVGFAQSLMPILERKAGRVLANGFPTGVEVCASMVHGGPYPASTNFGATSVGTMSIRRFLRPVSYQNIPAELLPDLP